VLLPQHYIVSKFYQYAGAPKYNRLTKTYQGSCPICREGKSWLRKKRLYYIPDKESIFCHNCGWSSKPLKWLIQVSGMTKQEIEIDSNSFDTIDVNAVAQTIKKQPVASLPGECVNLMCNTQLQYYKDNAQVQKVYKYAEQRGLFSAINKPTALYACTKDETHNGRLILPFFDANNKIAYYQSRSVAGEQPKYMSKVMGDRTLFNFNNIKSSCSDVFIFEGPIDCCFVENGVAVAGIQERSMQLFSTKQQQQINSIQGFYNFIWVLDSQWQDSASKLKTQKLIDCGETVFIWPRDLGTACKDFNDIALKYNVNSISHKFIKQHCVKGMQAQIMLQAVQTYL
jgi:hypothetical protein